MGVYYPEQPYQVIQMSRTPSPSNRYDALLVDDEEGSDDRRSPPQPRPRPLRTLTPNTRTAYAARASARRAALIKFESATCLQLPLLLLLLFTITAIIQKVIIFVLEPA